MQPYQAASEEIKRQGELPLKLAKNAASAGLTVAGGAFLAGGAINRILPFLSKYIPEDLAIKGLNKIDPRYGSFVDKAMAAGKSFDEVKDFIGDKIKSAEPAKEDRNIIKQESPELHSFVDQEIRKGRKPIEAGAMAQNDKRFSSIIEKLTKSHNTPWSQIIQSVFGTGEMASPGAQESQQASQGLDPGVAQILQQGNELLKRFRGQ